MCILFDIKCPKTSVPQQREKVGRLTIKTAHTIKSCYMMMSAGKDYNLFYIFAQITFFLSQNKWRGTWQDMWIFQSSAVVPKIEKHINRNGYMRSTNEKKKAIPVKDNYRARLVLGSIILFIFGFTAFFLVVQIIFRCASTGVMHTHLSI